MEIRPYEARDASSTLALFVDAVLVTASKDYSPAQTEAWARAGERDLDAWHAARLAARTEVAVVQGVVAGFADIDDAGHVGMLYVAPKFGRRGVASALLARLLERAVDAGLREVTTDASITARPFFERRAFTAVAQQRRRTGGVELTNYRMVRRL